MRHQLRNWLYRQCIRIEDDIEEGWKWWEAQIECFNEIEDEDWYEHDLFTEHMQIRSDTLRLQFWTFIAGLYWQAARFV